MHNKKLLDEVFVICRIINVKVRVILSDNSYRDIDIIIIIILIIIIIIIKIMIIIIIIIHYVYDLRFDWLATCK